MTPMMEQYFEIKNQYKDFLLFYRLGDFYEMFFDDAILASRELGLTLTGRDCGEAERAPMCGVPFHSSEGYIGTLIEKGYKVAICEQTEDPALAKGLVKREVVRIVTPGTVMETGLLNETRNNYLASVYMTDLDCGVAFADISTGQVFATSLTGTAMMNKLLNELGTYRPSEVIASVQASALSTLEDFVSDRLGAMLTRGEASKFDYELSSERVKEHFGERVDDEVIENRVLISALGALLVYIADTQKTDISYIKELTVYNDGQYLEMDINTRRNLELIETMRSKEKKGSLLWVLDKTKTAPGARLLRNWVEHPLLSASKIARRQRAVSELAGDFMLREEIADLLSGVLDLERLIARTVYGTANAKDLRAIRNSISILPELREILGRCTSDELSSILAELDPLGDIFERIDTAICDDPPFSVREGGIIAEGFNADVDRLRSIMSDGKGWIQRIAEEEKVSGATFLPTIRNPCQMIFAFQQSLCLFVWQIVVFKGQQHIFHHGILVSVFDDDTGRLVHKPALKCCMLSLEFPIELCVKMFVSHSNSFLSQLSCPSIGGRSVAVIVSTISVNDLIFLLVQVKQDVEFVQAGRFLFQFVLLGERCFRFDFGCFQLLMDILKLCLTSC